MIRFFLTITLSLFLSACLISPGTNTGNPGVNEPSPVSGIDLGAPYLAAFVCGKIKSCNSHANTQNCYLQIYTLSGYTSELGATAGAYNTMQDLSTAESNGLVTPNKTNAQNCLTAIAKLSCTDGLVQSAYSSSNPSDYSATNLLFQAAPACQQIY